MLSTSYVVVWLCRSYGNAVVYLAHDLVGHSPTWMQEGSNGHCLQCQDYGSEISILTFFALLFQFFGFFPFYVCYWGCGCSSRVHLLVYCGLSLWQRG